MPTVAALKNASTVSNQILARSVTATCGGSSRTRRRPQHDAPTPHPHFKPEELVVHALYRTQDGPNPGTKARTREAAELARAGLQDALEAIEGRVDVVGVSGY